MPNELLTRFSPNSPLAEQLRLKKSLMEANDPSHQQIRTALIGDSGVFLGAESYGAVLALAKLGFSEVFDYKIGTSVTAGVFSHDIAGQHRQFHRVLTED